MESPTFEDIPLPRFGVSSPLVSLPVDAKPERTDLGALFRSEESGLLRFAIGLVGRRSVAEELAQEAFLRLHQVWGEVENPRAWLYRCLRNLALNHLRDRPKEVGSPAEALPNGEMPPPELLGRHEAVGMVRLLLAEMPSEDRRLVHLKYHDNLKYREISERTGLSIGNVGYRLHHLLKGLADALRRAGVEGSQG
ncbi:MAG: RNA polymerase subunit sigma-24 [Verrucomicrobia bacterium RIFCSPLOWO2_12_FULL_64_8]|nr:MAG: RNA polymerase subunit sigma-24 [Verrucomicrobia bacterium RIFCSPLOWO2_12_FULL_64_8]